MADQIEDINQDISSLDLWRYLALFWQWAWLIFLVAVLAGGAAYMYSKRLTPIYQSAATVLINQTTSSQYDISYVTPETYSKMMTAQPVLDEVARQLNYEGGGYGLDVSVSYSQTSQLVVVSARSEDPEFAAQVANALVEVFSQKVLSSQQDRYTSSKQNLQKQIDDVDAQVKNIENQLQNAQTDVERVSLSNKLSDIQSIYSNLVMTFEQVRMAEAENVPNIVSIEPAVPSGSPISPKVQRNTLLATLVGALLVMAAIFAFDALDDTIRTPEEITRKLGLPVLAVISHFDNTQEHPVTEEKPRSPVSEAFRSLRTNVQYTSVDYPLQTIMVTSAEPGEGKTTITVNLAIVFAQGGRRVTLVDADLRHPSIHKRLEYANRSGLSSLFMNSVENLNGTVQKTRIENLSIVTAGDIPPNPSELLGSQKMGRILAQFKDISDLVLMDTPPVTAVTDATVLVPLVDGVLIVVKPGATRFTSIRRTIEQLNRANANIIGVVFNDLNLRSTRYRYSYYYRGYYDRYYNKYYSDDSATPSSRKSKKVRSVKEKVD
jgi:capsular exopolysaccharide synthesis family protein